MVHTLALSRFVSYKPLNLHFVVILSRTQQHEDINCRIENYTLYWVSYNIRDVFSIRSIAVEGNSFHLVDSLLEGFVIAGHVRL